MDFDWSGTGEWTKSYLNVKMKYRKNPPDDNENQIETWIAVVSFICVSTSVAYIVLSLSLNFAPISAAIEFDLGSNSLTFCHI